MYPRCRTNDPSAGCGRFAGGTATGSDNHGHEAAEFHYPLLHQSLVAADPIPAKTATPGKLVYRYRPNCRELSTCAPQTRRPAEYERVQTPDAPCRVEIVGYRQNPAECGTDPGRAAHRTGKIGLHAPNAVVALPIFADFSIAGTGDKGFNADRCATANRFCRPDQNRANRIAYRNRDPLASASLVLRFCLRTTAPNPAFPGRIHLLRHPPRGSIVGTLLPVIRRLPCIPPPGNFRAGDRTVGSAR